MKEREEISRGIESLAAQRAKQMIGRRRLSTAESPCYLYVYEAPGVVKVGITQEGGKRRLQKLCTYSPVKWVLVWELQLTSRHAAAEIESRFKHEHQQYRMDSTNTEVFDKAAIGGVSYVVETLLRYIDEAGNPANKGLFD